MSHSEVTTQQSPGTPNTSSTSTVSSPQLPAEPRHPVLLACSRVFDAFKGGNHCEVLQAFDELQAMDLEMCPEHQADILAAWGRGILAAAHMCSDDAEHLSEMIDDYEGRFQAYPTPYLRVLVDASSSDCTTSPLEALRAFLNRNPPPPPPPTVALETADAGAMTSSGAKDGPAVEGGESTLDGSHLTEPIPVKQLPPLAAEPVQPSPHAKYILDAVDGLTERFRSFTCSDSKQLYAEIVGPHRLSAAAVPTKLVEKLQRPYIARLKSKTEDVEAVFDEMLQDGLRPVSAVPFTFLFMKQKPSKPLVEHYYMQMLSFGIKPVDSLFRLLVRNPSLSKDELSFIKRRMAGSTEMDDFYERKLDRLRSVENEHVYDDATKLVLSMLLDGIVPSKHAFNKMIAMSRHDPSLAEAWYRKMIDLGVQPNGLTFVYLINVWKHHKLSDSVERWIGELTSRGMQLDASNYVSLLEWYVKQGQRSRAQNCFRPLLARGECTLHVYNTVMSLGPFDFAVGCLAAMLSDGIEPNGATKEMLISLAKDDIANGIVDGIGAQGWSKVSLLSNSALVSPPKGTYPSLLDSMRLMMRELKLSDDDIRKRSEMLNAEVDLAKRKQ